MIDHDKNPKSRTRIRGSKYLPQEQEQERKECVARTRIRKERVWYRSISRTRLRAYRSISKKECVHSLFCVLTIVLCCVLNTFA